MCLWHCYYMLDFCFGTDNTDSLFWHVLAIIYYSIGHRFFWRSKFFVCTFFTQVPNYIIRIFFGRSSVQCTTSNVCELKIKLKEKWLYWERLICQSNANECNDWNYVAFARAYTSEIYFQWIKTTSITGPLLKREKLEVYIR